MKTGQALRAVGNAQQKKKIWRREKPGSKEPLRTEDLFLSLAESLAKTGLYDLFMTEILSLDVCVCLNQKVRKVWLWVHRNQLTIRNEICYWTVVR